MLHIDSNHFNNSYDARFGLVVFYAADILWFWRNQNESIYYPETITLVYDL